MEILKEPGLEDTKEQIHDTAKRDMLIGELKKAG